MALLSSFDQMLQRKDSAQIEKLLSTNREILYATDAEMRSALFHAGLCNDEQFGLSVVETLLERGADPHHRDKYKETVVFYLAREGKSKIMERLLQSYDYDLNDTDIHNQNPLFFAARNGRLRVAELLVKHNVNINHIDFNGETCLFFAASEGHLQMCKFLINRGCNPLLVGYLKASPLTYAKRNGQTHVVQYINGLKKQQYRDQGKAIEAALKSKKKKDVQRVQYILVYTGEDGQMQHLSKEDIQAFRKQSRENDTICNYMYHPESLEGVPMKQEPAFLKPANRIINSLLKRPDLSVFHLPVDGNLVPDYYIRIARSMDLTTIRNKLSGNCYANGADFIKDLQLIFDNCHQYNGDDHLGRFGEKVREEVRVLTIDQGMID